MSGILGILGSHSRQIDITSFLVVLNPLSSCDTKVLTTVDGYVAVSWHGNDLLRSSRFYEDAHYAACFSGDLIDFREVPWEKVLRDFRNRRYEHFSSYRGTYAIAIFEKENRRISIVSDRISQHPIYYLATDDGFIFSTTISAYSKLAMVPDFNVDWLHEFLFFNYPVGQTTFLKNVLRMPPATVYQYDLETSQSQSFEYSGLFKKEKELIAGREAFEKAQFVFNESIPRYFDDELDVAVSLTAGLDSRTVLSFGLTGNRESLVSYTYGIDNCYDLREASKIASALQLPHIKIIFDDEFLAELIELMYETVYLSHGLERVNRATLLYVYRMLTNRGQRFPLVVTGVSGDHLFRDHMRGLGNVPALISSAMMRIYREGMNGCHEEFFKKTYGDNYGGFETHIRNVLSNLQTRYGTFDSAESYLSYLIYEVAPKYFAGEAAIANHYSTFRTPFWDTDIIRLSYEIEFATLGFSEHLDRKDKYRECVLQASLIRNIKHIPHVPFRGIPLHLYSSNNKILYTLYRVFNRGPSKIKSLLIPTRYPLPEDWSMWFDTVLSGEIDRLIGKDSLISNYIQPEFLRELKQKKDAHWLGKVITVEIILNLLKKRWCL